MVEAYWSMYCNSDEHMYRGGTVVFLGGSIVGHDLEHEFQGSYQIAGDAIRAKVRVLHYGRHRDLPASPREFDLMLEGKVARQRMVLRGRTLEKQPRIVRIICLKRADISHPPASPTAVSIIAGNGAGSRP